MIAIWAFPFIGQGASTMYKSFSSKQQDKTNEEIRKEAGVNKESLEDIMKELKEKNPNISKMDLLAVAENTQEARIQKKNIEYWQRKVNKDHSKANEANKELKEDADNTPIERTEKPVDGDGNN
jgi:hypothetical protein